jgi:hypothetical protein
MELDSGKNWLQAANLGARAVIYIDRGESFKQFFKEKFELSPLQFPRFWMSLAEAEKAFGDFENAPDGVVDDETQLFSQIRWQVASSENIYCFVDGTNPKLKERLIMVEAFYDSTATVAGLSPGADEAVSIATLLELARFLKENPPQRSVLMIASSGHAQTLAGMREMIWSISARSKDMRKLKKSFKALVKEKRKIIKLLKNMPLDSAGTGDPADEEITRLLKAAIDERLKTESDRVSRRLMQLRLEKRDKANTENIQKLADERLLLKRLMFSSDYTDLSDEDRRALSKFIPKAIQDQKAILSDVGRHSREIGDARSFRSQVKAYDLDVAVSLHLSSHGDGFGAFNYGWMFPFRPRINRTAIYSTLDEVLRQGAARIENALGYSGMYKDSLRPSRKRSWQSYFLDQPPLGGELTALAGFHGLTFVTTHDARARWGTPYDKPGYVDAAFALKQSAVVYSSKAQWSAGSLNIWRGHPGCMTIFFPDSAIPLSSEGLNFCGTVSCLPISRRPEPFFFAIRARPAFTSWLITRARFTSGVWRTKSTVIIRSFLKVINSIPQAVTLSGPSIKRKPEKPPTVQKCTGG